MTVATVAAAGERAKTTMTTTTTTESTTTALGIRDDVEGIMSWSSSFNPATRVDKKQDSTKRDEDENSSSVCWEQITIQSKEPSDNDDEDDDASFSVLSLPAGGSVGSSTAASGVIMAPGGPSEQPPRKVALLPTKCMSSPNLTCQTPSVVLVDHTTHSDVDDDDDDLTVQTMMSADSHVVISPQPNSPPPKVVVSSSSKTPAPPVWGGAAAKTGGAWGGNKGTCSFRDVMMKNAASTPALPVTKAPPPAPRRRVPFRPKIVVQQSPPKPQPLLRRRNSKSLNDLGAAGTGVDDKNGKVPTILEEEDDYDDYDCDEAYYGQKSMGASSHRVGRRERPDEAKRRMHSMAKRDVQRQQGSCGGGRRRK